MDVWLLLRLLAFAMTPVWVFSAAWALLVGVPARGRGVPVFGPVLGTVFGPVAAGLVRPPAADLVPDPFRTLGLQRRLTALAAELDVLAADTTMPGRADRLTAVTAAFDDVLDDACTLAGIPIPIAPGVGREVARLRRESALRAAGWSW